MDKEDYYLRYDNLYNMIIQAYMDRYVLEQLDKYNKSLSEEKNTLNSNYSVLLHHYVYLIKVDLAFTLWKLCDADKKSNTLITLKNRLNSERPNNILAASFTKKSKELITGDLSTFRNQIIAHNDLDKKKIEIKTSDLFHLLDDACNYLYLICCNDIDDRVKPFDDNKKGMLMLDISLRTHFFISDTMKKDNKS